jgi:D-aspartate ligase
MPNPQQAQDGWPPVVVASVFQTGLNLMRGLIGHGVRAVGVDTETTNEGFRSIYGKSHVCPNPDLQPSEWVRFMQSLSRELGSKPVIIPAADIFVSALGRHAEALQDYYIFANSSVALQAALATKEQQYALAKEYGLPCPRTEHVRNSQSLREFASTAQFPCLLKPKQHREWETLPTGNTLRGRKLVTAETAEELMRHYDLVQAYRPDVVVQEIIAGPDSAKYCYLSAYGRDGSRLGYCVVQEFRAQPVFFGSASIVQPVEDDEIQSVCDRFLREIGYVGLCEIEVKRDVRNGKLMLVEVNPRFSGTADSASYAGVDVGWLHYLDLIGYNVEPASPNRFHFRHIVLRREIPAAIKYLQEGMITWRELMDSYRFPLEFFDLDMRDWRVTAGTLKFCVRSVGGALLRRAGLKH